MTDDDKKKTVETTKTMATFVRVPFTNLCVCQWFTVEKDNKEGKSKQVDIKTFKPCDYSIVEAAKSDDVVPAVYFSYSHTEQLIKEIK